MRELAKLCVVLAIAACGGGNHLPDAPPGDHPDAPPGTPDGAPMTVTVHVSQEDFDPNPGAPIEGADIVATPPSGQPASYTTDATGTATFPIAAGTDLWVERPAAALPAVLPGVPSYEGRLYLIMSVDPGADIQLGSLPRGAAGTPGVLGIDYTPYAGGGGLYTDSDLDGCTDSGNVSVPGALQFTTYDRNSYGFGCTGGPRELVLTATSPASGLPVAWLTVPGIATAPGTVDGTGATWDTTGTTYTVNLTNHAADVAYGYTYYRALGSWHGFNTNGPISGGTGTYSITDATLPTPAVVLTELYHLAAQAQYVIDPVSAVPANHAVDGGALLPYISQPAFDPATRTISWSEVTPGAVPPQLVTASFGYYDSVDSTQYRWTIYAPGDTTELVIPDVPDAITTHDLQPTDVVFPDVWLLDVATRGYAAVLADLDLYRNDPKTYPPATRVLVSGGYGGGKVARSAHHD